MLILLNPENKQSFENGHLGGCNIKGDPALELIKTWRVDTSADRKYRGPAAAAHGNTDIIFDHFFERNSLVFSTR